MAPYAPSVTAPGRRLPHCIREPRFRGRCLPSKGKDGSRSAWQASQWGQGTETAAGAAIRLRLTACSLLGPEGRAPRAESKHGHQPRACVPLPVPAPGKRWPRQRDTRLSPQVTSFSSSLPTADFPHLHPTQNSHAQDLSIREPQSGKSTGLLPLRDPGRHRKRGSSNRGVYSAKILLTCLQALSQSRHQPAAGLGVSGKLLAAGQADPRGPLQL